MTLTALIFYLFSTIAIFSALMVITVRNPVHSVLFLILCFFQGAGLMLLLGAEFLAMLLIIVYVGAVAVLFLFVVMMLDLKPAALRKGAAAYLPIGLLVGGVLLGELVLVAGAAMDGGVNIAGAGSGPVPTPEGTTNTAELGKLLYTDYLYVFQASGIVLLVAMIGAIVLTLRPDHKKKLQSVPAQVARTPQTAIEVKKVKVGEGI